MGSFFIYQALRANLTKIGMCIAVTFEMRRQVRWMIGMICRQLQQRLWGWLIADTIDSGHRHNADRQNSRDSGAFGEGAFCHQAHTPDL